MTSKRELQLSDKRRGLAVPTKAPTPSWEMNDSTAPGFVPFWERCTREELIDRIQRLRRARFSCVGRAAWLRPEVEHEIERLIEVGKKRFGNAT